jgi:hypothetical protein
MDWPVASVILGVIGTVIVALLKVMQRPREATLAQPLRLHMARMELHVGTLQRQLDAICRRLQEMDTAQRAQHDQFASRLEKFKDTVIEVLKNG